MKGKLSELGLSICLVLVLGTLPLMAACAEPAPEPVPEPTPTPVPAPTPAPIELKMTTYLAPNQSAVVGAMLWSERVNQRANGELTIKILGGPEVVAGLEQGKAVQKGMIDIAAVPASYVRYDVVPAAHVLMFDRLTPAEERQPGGIYHVVQGWCQEAGLYDIGNFLGYGPDSLLYMFSNKKITKLDDLRGLKLGATSPPLEKWDWLDLAETTIPYPEVYTGLERGVINLLLTLMSSYQNMSLHEVAPFIINHPFFSGNGLTLVNLDTWNKVPKHLQDVMTETMIEVEKELPDKFSQMTHEALQKSLKGGATLVELPPDEAELFLDKVYEGSIELAMEEWPDRVQSVRPLLGW